MNLTAIFSESNFIRAASVTVAGFVTVVGVILLERMGEVTKELGSIQTQIAQVDKIGELEISVARLTDALADMKITKPAYIQLSSAKNQDASALEPMPVHMELRDAISNVHFDPRRSDTDVGIVYDGAYFVIAAPQTKYGRGCYDLWLRINGSDVENSNIRVCQSDASQTTVGVSQGVLCLNESDVLNVMHSGTGIEATKPRDEPLIPSIIFTSFRLGPC